MTGGRDVVSGRDEVAQDFGTVDALPVERVIGQLIALVPADFRGHKIGNTAFLENLRKSRRIAEYVRQPENPVVLPELLSKKPFAIEQLPNQCLTGGQIAVRLHEHAALRLPSALGHSLLDLGIDLRSVALNILIKLRLAGHEDILGIATHQLQHSGEASDSLILRDGQRPEPRHVDVGVAHATHQGLRRTRLRVQTLPQMLFRPGR